MNARLKIIRYLRRRKRMANTIKAIDLFSGCGGVSCGLTNMKFSVKAAVEIEKSTVDIYSNYPPLSNGEIFADRKILLCF